jgi:hypothetical protein
MTVDDVLRMINPYRNAPDEGARRLNELGFALERFSLGTPVKNPPDSAEDAAKTYTTARLVSGKVVLE